MRTEPSRKSNVRERMDSLFLAALLVVSCFAPGCQKTGQQTDENPRVMPVVSSTQLSETQIIPTLETPLADSGNAVWCATFQVAWNNMRDDVIGGPVQISNAQEVTDRLNASTVTEAALPSGSYFAAAGRLEDGIIETIRQEMARKFPDVQLPEFDGAVGFVTYGYLDTKAAFTTPFVDTNQPIQFSDAAGAAHFVSGFGLHEGTDWDLRTQQAAQVKVLFSQTDEESNTFRPSAFALDLTADHADQQVIVAVLPRASHLRAALDDLASRIEKFPPDEYAAELQEIDTLAIPNVAFHVKHEFAELQGGDKAIENPGEFQNLPVVKAMQSIRFRLDKSGAAVVSESNMYPGAEPRHFVVDRPFLIVMKHRSSDEPYFVAWIDNSELLEVSDPETESGT